MAFSPDNRVLAVGDRSRVALWDAATLRPLGELGTVEPVTSQVFSADGAQLAVGTTPNNGTDGSIGLWDVASHQKIAQAPAEQHGGINVLAISPDNQMLVSAADSMSLALWNFPMLQFIGLLMPDSEDPSGLGGPRAASFSPDNRLATRTGDALLVWDTDPSSWQSRACRGPIER